MYKGKVVLVTGGASFIGSHLVDSLLGRGAEVLVVDDFSSGRLTNLEYPLEQKQGGVWAWESLTVKEGDLKDRCFTKEVLEGVDVVFHLAALHGGRGYIQTHPAQCCTNMILDQLVFEEAARADVDRICFASSACVYPSYLQMEEGSTYLLKEEDADPFVRDKAFADLEYGWAKLMGEMALQAYHRQYGMKTSSVRIFTCFSPDTFVMTPQGLKNIAKFEVGDKVYTLNPDTHEVEVVRVVATQKFFYRGELIEAKHRNGLDWLVTPDHKVYLQTNDKNRFKFVEAKIFLSTYNFEYRTPVHKAWKGGYTPQFIDLWEYVDNDHFLVATPKNPHEKAYQALRSRGYEKRSWTHTVLIQKEDVSTPANFEGECHIRLTVRDFERGCKDMPFSLPTSAFLRFLAWYITEGSVRRGPYSQITISKKDEGGKKEIADSIREMGIPVSVGARDVSCSSRLLRNFIEGEVGVGARNKRIPDFIFSMDLSARCLFLETLMKGDGDRDGTRYTTVSGELAYDVVHLAFLCGLKARAIRDGDVYRVHIRRGSQRRSIKPRNIQTRQYEGYVYCITAEKNHIIYAGRESQDWIGQCYGPRENETHAIIALIAKAFVRMDPYVIWGTGEQDRNFTYVQDIVDAMMLAGERITDGSAINAGRDDRITINQTVELIFEIFGWRPSKIERDLSKPQGVSSRAADLSRSSEVLGWKPKVSYREGFDKTIRWYTSKKDVKDVKENLRSLLMER